MIPWGFHEFDGCRWEFPRYAIPVSGGLLLCGVTETGIRYQVCQIPNCKRNVRLACKIHAQSTESPKRHSKITSVRSRCGGPLGTRFMSSKPVGCLAYCQKMSSHDNYAESPCVPTGTHGNYHGLLGEPMGTDGNPLLPWRWSWAPLDSQRFPCNPKGSLGTPRVPLDSQAFLTFYQCSVRKHICTL